jgi:hypothetical protein
MKTFIQFYSDVLCEGAKLGLDTSWEDTNDEGKKIKVTMRQVLKFLDKNQIPVERISTSKIKPIIIDQDYEGTAKERVEKADLKYPIVVIKSKGKLKSILDGNHRAYKAIKRKNKFISARILDIDSEDAPSSFKELFNYKISPKFSKQNG